MSRKNGLLTNMFWKFSERISAQLISTIVSIILARILEPSHYGVISIVMIFITLANVFVSDGLGTSLVQKKDATKLDFFSVLYFNIAFSCVLYLIIFFAAPFISVFFGEGYEILTPVLRVLGIRIIFTAVNSVQHAYISKKMIFKKYFLSTLLGTIFSAIVGISMAYLGCGVWALVAQYMASTTVSTLVLYIVLNKKPKLMFSVKSLRELFPYGMCILGTKLLITGYMELRALIIGKIYSSKDLAYYDKGRQFPNLLVTNIDSTISTVLFPKMSNEQNDMEKVKFTTRNSIRYSSFVLCPMMLGLAAVAEPFVRLVLTEKWIECVPLLQLFCIVYLFQPIHSANMQAVKAIGRGDVYMKLEVLKKIIELLVLVIIVRRGVEAIVIGMALCTTLFTFVNAYPNKKLLNYNFREQIGDLLPSVVCSLIMFVFVFLINFCVLNDILKIILQFTSGILIYILTSALINNQIVKGIWRLIVHHLKNLNSKKDKY